MPLIEEIRRKFAQDGDQAILRSILVGEIREAALTAEIIEDYPDDKYGPSCLLLGFIRDGRPLHIQCSYPSRPLLKIITVYEPSASEWVEYRKRR